MMMKATVKSLVKRILPVGILTAAAVIGLAPQSGWAVNCVVNTSDPDAFIGNTVANNSSYCDFGAGPNDPGPSGGTIGTLSGTWTYVDRDLDSVGAGFSENNLVVKTKTGVDVSFGATTTGYWYIDLDPGAAGGTDNLTGKQLVLVIKDGPNGGPDRSQWVWALIDTAAGCTGAAAAYNTTGAELCGEWSMWGNQNGQQQGISHMTLYTQGESAKVPEPSAFFLIGAGLLAIRIASRRLAAQGSH